jgi:2-desacetyl-2-hydroxyethyl bacteriochlorophyllide A dehydrogenase
MPVTVLPQAPYRKIQFTGQSALRIATGPVPTPAAGQLLLQTTRTLISTGTEGICFTRNFAPGTHWDGWVKYPFDPGYLQVGQVIALGPGVTGWNIGDRAVTRAGHASHALVSADQVLHVPDNVPDDDAVWMGLGKITQLGVRAAEHVLGDDVVIVGLGLLGQLVVQYVRLMGARRIIAIDTAPLRLEMAQRHGATHTLSMTAADALPRIKEITCGRLADVVYDITGFPAVFASALPLARRFGKVVLLGDAGSPHLQTLTPDVVTRGVRIVGAHDSHAPATATDREPWTERAIYELFLTYLSRGQVQVRDLVTHRFQPQQAPEVYAMLQTPQRQTCMGVMFEWC